MKKSYKVRSSCRVCGASRFEKILDLGAMPPANAFLTKNNFRRERTFPLSIHLCRRCGYLGMRHVVNPSLLFSDYAYLTSASEPLVRHYSELGRSIVKKYVQDSNDLVIEIGSNDGTLLAAVADYCRVLGIDPAKGPARQAEMRGVKTVTKYFTSAVARELRKEEGRAKVIVANNVVGHLDDLHDLMRGVTILLAPDGRFIFEVHWVGNLVRDGGFDQIYHEHLSYFSLSTAARVLRRHGLVVEDATLEPIHGMLLRVVAGKGVTPKARVRALVARERSRALEKARTYREFARNADRTRSAIRELLLRLRKEGKRIVGYGAPAKGNTLLNSIGADSSLIEYIVDTTASKQGTYAPGSHIAILPPEEFLQRRPDYVLLLAWNYADAILKKERHLLKAGIKFIIPVPIPRIIE